MLVPIQSREQRKTALKQNLVDALFELRESTPNISKEELELFAKGYQRGKIKRQERGYRVD